MCKCPNQSKEESAGDLPLSLHPSGTMEGRIKAKIKATFKKSMQQRFIKLKKTWAAKNILQDI